MLRLTRFVIRFIYFEKKKRKKRVNVENVARIVLFSFLTSRSLKNFLHSIFLLYFSSASSYVFGKKSSVDWRKKYNVFDVDAFDLCLVA